MNDQWQSELIEQLNKDLSLSAWSEYLRTLKCKGITQNEVRVLLNTFRNNTDEEAVHDHILELLDLVEGYCQPQYKVW